MIKKKLAISLLTSALLVTAGTTFTQAAAPAVYPVCTVNGCNITDNHEHNGSIYCGHSAGDGHEYHLLCNLSDCTLTGVHNHNDTTYLGHHSNTSGYTNTVYTAGYTASRHHSSGGHRGRHH